MNRVQQFLTLAFVLSWPMLNAQIFLQPVVDSIPMRDGNLLATDIYYTSNCTTCPTLLIQTPYNRLLFRLGLPLGIGQDIENMPFHVVVVDWRGFYGSVGALSLDTHRGEDGYDVVEWIADQPWSDGKVATWGPSALGQVQLNTIREHPPHLVCAIPEVAEPIFAYEEYFPGGVYRKEYGDQLDGLGFGLSGFLLANPVYNLIWSITEAETFYPEEIDVPVFMVGGWYDHNIELSLSFFSAVQQQSPADVRELHTFMIGPWVHGGNGPASLGTLNQGELSYPLAASWKDSLEWMFLNHYLLNETNEWPQQDPIIYYQMGDDLWDGLSSWPPTSSEEVWYLQADSTLMTDPASDASPAFVFDPRDPSPTHGGATLRFDQVQGSHDQRDTVESRADILLFTSPVLSQTVRVQGQISLSLFISSDRTDTDVAVRLMDVYPDGRSMLLTDDIQRMRFRNGFTANDTMNMFPGEVYEIQLQLPDLAHSFLPGHRIRLGISGSNYPRYDLNLNNGGNMYVAGDTLIATTSVHVGHQYSSHISFPTVSALTIDGPISSSKLTIFPNPATSTLTLDIATVGNIISSQEIQISVYDLQGGVISSQLAGAFPVVMPVTNLPNGIYIVEVKQGENLFAEKLIIR